MFNTVNKFSIQIHFKSREYILFGAKISGAVGGHCFQIARSLLLLDENFFSPCPNFNFSVFTKEQFAIQYSILDLTVHRLSNITT